MRYPTRLPAPFRLPALRGIPGSDAGYEPLLLRVRPGQVKARLRSFGGIGPLAAAAIRWLRPCGDCVAVRPVHLLFRAGAKRDGRAGVPDVVP